jgi:hypothetical protein
MEGQARERGEVGWVSPFVSVGFDWPMSALVGPSSGTTRKFCGGLFSVVLLLQSTYLLLRYSMYQYTLFSFPGYHPTGLHSNVNFLPHRGPFSPLLGSNAVVGPPQVELCILRTHILDSHSFLLLFSFTLDFLSSPFGDYPSRYHRMQPNFASQDYSVK